MCFIPSHLSSDIESVKLAFRLIRIVSFCVLYAIDLAPKFLNMQVFSCRINPGEDIADGKDKSQLDNSAPETGTLPMPVITDMLETRANVATELENDESSLNFGQKDCFMGTNAQESKIATVLPGKTNSHSSISISLFVVHLAAYYCCCTFRR